MRRLAVALVVLATVEARAQDAPPSESPEQEEMQPAEPSSAPEAPPPPAPEPPPAPPAPEPPPPPAPEPSPPAPAPAPAATPAPPPAGGAPGKPQRDLWTRLKTFFAPELSAVAIAAGGWYSDDRRTPKGADDPSGTGFTLQDVEVALQAQVDRWLRLDVFLAVPNLRGLEVEEAYAATTRLPFGLQVRGGYFRPLLGAQNTLHVHQLAFARRPAVSWLFLGLDGLKAPGVELSWMVPRLPFGLLVYFAALSAQAAPADQVLQTFGGGERYDFTYIAALRAMFDGRTTDVTVGAHYARGKTSQSQSAAASPLVPMPRLMAGMPGPTPYDNFYSDLAGADLTVAWSSPRAPRGVAWTTEYFLRHVGNVRYAGEPRPLLEGGLYTQLVGQVARKWLVAARGEVLGLPEDEVVRREYAIAGAVTWRFSEWAQVRLHGEGRFYTAPGTPKGVGAIFVQLQAGVGPHAAHGAELKR